MPYSLNRLSRLSAYTLILCVLDYPQDLQRALDASVGERERRDIEKATAESLAHSRSAELTVAKSSHYDADNWALVRKVRQYIWRSMEFPRRGGIAICVGNDVVNYIWV